MKRFYLAVSFAIVFMLTGVLVSSPVLAEKPPWAGGGKGEKNKPKEAYEKYDKKGGADRGESYGSKKHDEKGHIYFSEQNRASIHDYYAGQYRKGRCPPGLAKKHNGCMPPGQDRKWVIGQPLPPGVIFYDLPPNVLTILGPPPSRHRFVRVAQDILLIAMRTGMVIDAVDNLDWEFNH